MLDVAVPGKVKRVVQRIVITLNTGNSWAE